MADLVFSKNNFDISKLNSLIENFCTINSINNDNLLKIQLVCEEFISNILFPNFDGDVEYSISQNNNNTILTFRYNGADYMNKINDTTFLSLKILQNKTKDIKSTSSENGTTVEMIL